MVIKKVHIIYYVIKHYLRSKSWIKCYVGTHKMFLR